MTERQSPYLHDRFDVRRSAETLTQAITKLKLTAKVESMICTWSPGETSMLAIDEMGCKNGVDRKYYVTLKFMARYISQSQIPVLQRFGKETGMVLLFDVAPSESPDVVTHPLLYRLRVSFVAYANILA